MEIFRRKDRKVVIRNGIKKLEENEKKIKSLDKAWRNKQELCIQNK